MSNQATNTTKMDNKSNNTTSQQPAAVPMGEIAPQDNSNANSNANAPPSAPPQESAPPAAAAPPKGESNGEGQTGKCCRCKAEREVWECESCRKKFCTGHISNGVCIFCEDLRKRCDNIQAECVPCAVCCLVCWPVSCCIAVDMNSKRMAVEERMQFYNIHYEWNVHSFTWANQSYHV